MTHSMRKSTGESGDVFTIGIWTGSGWNSVRDFDDATDAAAFCNYLNGGDGKAFKPPSEAEQAREKLRQDWSEPDPESAAYKEPEPSSEPEQPEPWETAPRPTISAAARKRPKR